MIQVLLLGDSLVADNNWQQRMPGLKITNLGVPGAVTADLLNSLVQVKESSSHADVIMVMVGTNDLLSGNLGFAEPLKKIIVQLHRNYPLAELLICTLLPMELGSLPYNTIPDLNAQIESVAMQTGSCLLDTYRRFFQAKGQLFQDDGVHVTDKAYEIWTRTLIEHIAFLIEDD
jgi:lysophospholipase L1-like esterase